MARIPRDACDLIGVPAGTLMRLIKPFYSLSTGKHARTKATVVRLTSRNSGELYAYIRYACRINHQATVIRLIRFADDNVLKPTHSGTVTGACDLRCFRWEHLLPRCQEGLTRRADLRFIIRPLSSTMPLHQRPSTSRCGRSVMQGTISGELLSWWPEIPQRHRRI